MWFGTSEDYEIELVAWTDETIRRIRWEGPDLNVTRGDIDRDSLEDSYRQGGGADTGGLAFRAVGSGKARSCPTCSPRIRGLMMGGDGVIWVHEYLRPGQRSEWFAFDADGTWTRTLVLPSRTVCSTSVLTGRLYGPGMR